MARLPLRSVVLGRGGQHPGQVVEHAAVLGIDLEGFLVVGDGLGLFALAQMGIGPAAKRRHVLRIGAEQLRRRSRSPFAAACAA